MSEIKDLIAAYAKGVSEVAAALDGFTEETVRVRPFENKWTAAEIVHHLGDSEMMSAIRLRKLVSEENPLIYGYDQEAFAKSLRYNERPLLPSFEAFRAARESSLQILQMLSPEDFEKVGWHSESGIYTLRKWLEIYAAHALDHAAQIRHIARVLNIHQN